MVLVSVVSDHWLSGRGAARPVMMCASAVCVCLLSFGYLQDKHSGIGLKSLRFHVCCLDHVNRSTLHLLPNWDF